LRKVIILDEKESSGGCFMMAMTQLQSGDRAKIVDLSRVSELVRRRLLDMGVTEGVEVCLKCTMPLGGPFMIESCGQCLGIRRSEAMRIQVERV
jgi:ferrous iron transport protein A